MNYCTAPVFRSWWSLAEDYCTAIEAPDLNGLFIRLTGPVSDLTLYPVLPNLRLIAAALPNTCSVRHVDCSALVWPAHIRLLYRSIYLGRRQHLLPGEIILGTCRDILTFANLQRIAAPRMHQRRYPHIHLHCCPWVALSKSGFPIIYSQAVDLFFSFVSVFLPGGTVLLSLKRCSPFVLMENLNSNLLFWLVFCFVTSQQ